MRPRLLRTWFAAIRLATFSAQVQRSTSKWLGQRFAPGHRLSSAHLSAQTPRACVIAIGALHPGFRQGREGGAGMPYADRRSKPRERWGMVSAGLRGGGVGGT